ncbi:hypothetical protein HAP47_0000360 [Bradyrhizobium sp. 41S5]|uniref:hypothetical protein n=1 Tax=Bradyrhizobium sp. 41S5 TaxID=1404443 RepID=UPI00156B7AAC|nr:hypothetical protein [Bradyrhizobium sp. 41S5]UFX45230.1 hypothetical protein HAP47_0000360 [Bradyrhizobium sp. 41S5]
MVRVLACFRNHPAFLAALAAGERTFDPGRPCWHGHKAPREVGGHQQCIECVRLAQDAKRRAMKRPANERPIVATCPVKPAMRPRLPDTPQFSAVYPQRQLREKRETNTTAAHSRFGYRPISARFPRDMLHKYETSLLAAQNSAHLDQLLREKTGC